MNRLSKYRELLVTSSIIFGLFLLIVLPLLVLFVTSLGMSGDTNLGSNNFWQDALQPIINSLLLGAGVVVMTTVIATPVALLLARTPLRDCKWLEVILLVPFMTPPYIASMGWILFFQKKGLLQQLVPSSEPYTEMFFSLGGMIMVMSFHLFPFMSTILKNAILNIGPNLEESASIAGAGRITILRRIVAPLLSGNYAIAALLVFVKTLAEYGTPATLGQRIGFAVFTTDIHRYAAMAPISFDKAASLSSVLIGICLLLWFWQNYFTTKRSYSLVGNAKVGLNIEGKNNWFGVGCFYLFFLFFCAVVIPYFSAISTSLIKLRGYGLAAGNFTLDHYQNLLASGGEGLAAIGVSLFLAITAATVASIIGLGLVVSIRKNSISKKIIEGEALLPEMVPGIVMVIGLMILWNKLYTVLPVYNTIGFMVLVYVLLFLPYAYQYTASGYLQIGPQLLEAARLYGAGPWQRLRRITFPLIGPSLLSGWMMIFIIVFRELVAASLISPPNVLTVSTFIVSEFNQGSVAQGMAMAVICVMISISVLMWVNIKKR